MSNVVADSANPQVPAISGKHSSNGRGVVASSEQGVALEASATKDTAVFAHSDTGMGVDARSKTGRAVVAASEQGVALEASATKDTAVFAHSGTGRGIDARSAQGIALEASATKDTAVFAHSETGIGVDGRSKTHTGIWGSSEQGIGVRGKGGQYAGYFEGIVMVTGDVQLQNADCAEDFDVLAGEGIVPGTVMVIDSEGAMRQSTKAYDRCVAGVVSGAGDLKPGLVLGKHPEKTDRLPIALIGQVYCKVDADYSPIQVGDLLTTSNTPGYAMKASDPSKAFGAVIGKALRPLESGRDFIPILVALQ